MPAPGSRTTPRAGQVMSLSLPGPSRVTREGSPPAAAMQEDVFSRSLVEEIVPSQTPGAPAFGNRKGLDKAALLLPAGESASASSISIRASPMCCSRRRGSLLETAKTGSHLAGAGVPAGSAAQWARVREPPPSYREWSCPQMSCGRSTSRTARARMPRCRCACPGARPCLLRAHGGRRAEDRTRLAWASG